MTIRPLHDRILVKRLEEETKTAGGLFIPDTAKEKPIQAKVVAVGAGKRDKDGKVRAENLGQRVTQLGWENFILGAAPQTFAGMPTDASHWRALAVPTSLCSGLAS